MHFYFNCCVFTLISRNQHIKSEETAANLVIALALTADRCIHSVFSENDLTGANCHIVDEIIYECCRLLRNSCAIGNSIQNCIIALEFGSHPFFETINLMLFDLPTAQPKLAHKTHKMCWQFVANLCVQNVPIQRQMWQKCIEPLVSKLNCVCNTGNSRECTMILYNLFINEILNTNDTKKIIELLLECISDRSGQHELQLNDFYQLFMEHFITKYRSVVSIYDRISPLDKRINIIYYIADHMKTMNHLPISTPLLQFMCKELKKKSDCVLRSNSDQIHPREVIALLEIIAQASSDERYSYILSNDSSLFLNVGCLLRSIHEVGKRQTDDGNIFAPVQKLEQLAPNSSVETSIERDISYQLKTMLIRILANLTHKNKTNQDLVSYDLEYRRATACNNTLKHSNSQL